MENNERLASFLNTSKQLDLLLTLLVSNSKRPELELTRILIQRLENSAYDGEVSEVFNCWSFRDDNTDFNFNLTYLINPKFRLSIEVEIEVERDLYNKDECWLSMEVTSYLNCPSSVNKDPFMERCFGSYDDYRNCFHFKKTVFPSNKSIQLTATIKQMLYDFAYYALLLKKTEENYEYHKKVKQVTSWWNK